MFKGTERFPEGYIDRFVMASGGTGNAVTSYDYTMYYQRLPKQKLAALMELEADRMVSLQLREEHVGPELGAVLEERRGNENGPGFLLGERLAAARFPNHPYGRSAIGSEAEIKALNRADALAFYQRYYAPNNAILVVAGDVTESEVRALAEKAYARVPARKDLPQRAVHRLPDRPLKQRVEVEHERVATPSIGFYYLTPGVQAMPRAEATALNLLSHIAGAPITGRVHRALVIDQRLAVSVSASFAGGIHAGTFAFTATATPGVSAAALERALAGHIAALARDGVTESEVDDARRGYLAAKVYAHDNHRSRASAYGAALVAGLSVADVDATADRIARATAADINRLAASWLGESQPVVGVLLPRRISQVDGLASTERRPPAR